MNKICEYNKGGQCQIATITKEPEVLTRWIDPTIKEKDKEIERLKNINDNLYDELVGWIVDYENNIVNNDVYGKYIYVDDLVSKIEELKEGKK